MRQPLQGRHGYGPRRSPPRRPAGPFQLPQHRRERMPPPVKEKPPVQELIIPRGPKIISTKKKEEEKKQEEETEKKEEEAKEGKTALRKLSQVKITKIFHRKIVNIFLPISFNIHFGCSKEPSHWDDSFEYPQHMFWLRNKKIIFCYTLLT